MTLDVVNRPQTTFADIDLHRPFIFTLVTSVTCGSLYVKLGCDTALRLETGTPVGFAPEKLVTRVDFEHIRVKARP